MLVTNKDSIFDHFHQNFVKQKGYLERADINVIIIFYRHGYVLYRRKKVWQRESIYQSPV